jgi:hypothetical protein
MYLELRRWPRERAFLRWISDFPHLQDYLLLPLRELSKSVCLSGLLFLDFIKEATNAHNRPLQL